MKKFLAIILSLIVLVVILFFIAWANKASIAAHFLSKELGVPVRIEKMEYSSGHLSIDGLHIGNPPRSHTNTAFSSEKLDIFSTLEEVFGKVLTIDTIVIKDIIIGIEFYNQSGSENNWSTIMKEEPKKKKVKKKDERQYHIKTLILKNLNVVLTFPNGNTKKFPALAYQEFHDITNETGFPIDQIEKAIFNIVLKEIFMKFGLKNIIETLNPSQWLPDFVPPIFPGMSKDRNSDKDQKKNQNPFDQIFDSFNKNKDDK